MLHKTLIIGAIITAGLGYALWDQSRVPASLSRDFVPHNIATLDKRAPDMNFTTLDGTAHKLEDFKGKIIIVNFWATWCPPCIVEFPQLLNLAERFEDDIVFIALSVNDSADEVNAYLPRLGEQTTLNNVLIAHDENKYIAHRIFNARKYPESFIISPDYHMAMKVTGITDWSDERLIKRIEALKP